MPRLFPTVLAIPAALVLAACATPALARHDAGTVPATIDFASCAKPMYPKAALAAKHEGAVVIAYLVGADGRASDSKIENSSGHPDLDEAARAAIAKCRFNPAMQEGKAIAEWMTMKYVWSLK